MESLDTEPVEKCYARVDRFEQAVRAHAFKGAQHPADREDIEREYHRSKRELNMWIDEIKRKVRAANAAEKPS